jgi:Mrp family chromosome partitioning ATPase
MDANFRSPVMEKLFHIKAEKGLLNLLEGGVKPREVITRVQNLDIVFTGNINGLNVDPFDMLCSDQFESFLTFARSSYDFVFIDSPSIKTSKDPLVLVPLVDGVVLVVEANRTQEKTIVMVKNKIEEMGGTIKGIVLNKQVNYVPTVIQDFLD